MKAGGELIALADLHEDLDPALPRWFTKDQAYVIESVHPVAIPSFVKVKCNDGKTTRLTADDIRGKLIYKSPPAERTCRRYSMLNAIINN